MLPFEVDLQPGESPYRQIVYAATKAVVAGDLLPGSPFPSVRVMSQALKINPNTAQKVVAELARNGILEVLPGVGTVVAEWGPGSPEERRRLLAEDLEPVLVEARRLGMTRREVQEAVAERWAALFDASGPEVDRAEGA